MVVAKTFDQVSVSVLILSYNHRDFIRKSIESVFIQAEHISDIELLVLDDGSSDGSQEIILELKNSSPIDMKVFFNEHEGVNSISKNFNFLISSASKKYISFLASDDLYLPDRFRTQIDLMENDNSIQFVYANGMNVYKGRTLGNVHPDFVVNLLLTSNPKELYKYVTSTTSLLYIQSILVRSSFFESFMPFNHKLIADDWVFNINCFKRLIDLNLKFSFVSNNVFIRNILSDSTSNDHIVHFKRVAETAEIYIAPKNYSFYFSFYLKYLKVSLKSLKVKESFSFARRIILMFLGSTVHNRKLKDVF